jgi:phosphotransferase system  glucose/maltose/N-acetylglucosamine-specific IIC component
MFSNLTIALTSVLLALFVRFFSLTSFSSFSPRSLFLLFSPLFFLHPLSLLSLFLLSLSPFTESLGKATESLEE